MTQVPLQSFLVVAAGLFCVGVYGLLTRRNAVALLMSIELMLNAANLNLIAFGRYGDPALHSGQTMTLFVMMVAAAEAAVGLAIVLCVYRNRRRIDVDEMNLLRW